MILWRPIEVIDGIAYINWREPVKIEKIVIENGKKKSCYKIVPQDEKRVVK